jgi:hypothetical protein
MSLIRFACLLSLATVSSVGQTPQPTAVVRSFYTQVVAHNPRSIPTGADWKIFAPYLSRALQQKFDNAKACYADWSMHSPEAVKDSKYYLFSGNEYGYFYPGPHSFRVQKMESVEGGKLRVYVELTSKRPSEPPFNWRIAANVQREKGHFVVDDIIYVNDSTYDDPSQKPPDRTLSGYLAAGCNGTQWIGYNLPTQPADLAQSLYTQVVAHAPGGIPDGADWKIFSPYMSNELIHRIDLFNSCVADWDHKYDDPKIPQKAPFGIFESGMFSGSDEKTGPRAFHIDKVEPHEDGTTRVYATLKWWESEKPIDQYHVSAEKPYSWQVALILVHEDNRLLVDNVIFLKDNSNPGSNNGYQLSEELTDGCNGRRWVGYRDGH